MKAPCAEHVKKGQEIYSCFVLEASKAKALNKSKPKAPKPKVPKSSNPKDLKNSRPKSFKSKVLSNYKHHTLKSKVLKKEKSFRTNPKFWICFRTRSKVYSWYLDIGCLLQQQNVSIYVIVSTGTGVIF